MRMKLLRDIFAATTILIVFETASFAQGTLTNVSVSLIDNIANTKSIYTFNLTTDVNEIPNDGKIVITFPGGFDVSEAIIAQSTTPAKLDGGLIAELGGVGVIKITRDGTGSAVAPATAIEFRVGLIKNSQIANNNYSVTITTRLNDESIIAEGTSSFFSINHSSLASFSFATINNFIAGEDFSITISAKDAYNNMVKNFNDTAILSDTSKTIFPASTTSFSAGVWTGNVNIKRAGNNNEITAMAQNKSGISNKFNITHGSLNHFDIDDIPSAQMAGNLFNIRIVAQDQYNNIVSSFTDTVRLTDLTGSLQANANNFVGGILSNQAVAITKSKNDNYILATDPLTSITGQSNFFNVLPGNLAKFYINPIVAQIAGEWFPITVTAQDNNNNVVTTFQSNVTISDLSGTINPISSGEFAGGRWTGNVKISVPKLNDIITVTKVGGSEAGISNSFNVSEGSLDHFSIDNISTPQIAGTPFSITIKARDKEGNVVSSFSDQVNISDLTGFITPVSSSYFTNGVWTGLITLTKSKTNNRINVNGSNKQGFSNYFNVNPGALHHFSLLPIASPQIAGADFVLSIQAKDANENIVIAFSGTVNLSDKTGTISKTATQNFTSGEWSGAVNVKQKSENNIIAAFYPGSGKSGMTNFFNVQAATIDRLVIRNSPGGLGNEIGDLTFNLGDKLIMYAGGYDSWDNYVRDVHANWDTTGNIDRPSPLQGKSTTYNPITPYTRGRIFADSLGLISDTTGIFATGIIQHLKIRDAGNGAGNIVGNIEITADDSLTLYAAAYDAGDSYLGPISVTWSNDGGLQPLIIGNGEKVVFHPTAARVSGKIFASYASIPTASTGTVSVKPGAPVGTIILHPDQLVIAAHLDSFSTIQSDQIYDEDGNLIAEGELFTVTTDLGTVATPDAALEIIGPQIRSDFNGRLAFVLHAGTEGGTASIHVNSIGKGSAVGDTRLTIANLFLISINTDNYKVTQGQTNVPIRMVVNNVSPENINIINAGLKFIGPSPANNILTGEYSVHRNDGITELLANTQSALTFNCDLAVDATKGLVAIDGFITGQLSGLAVRDTSANKKDSFLVQSQPVLSIEKIEAFADTVIQGTNTTLTARIRNDGDAAVYVESDSITFWAISLGINDTKNYGQISYPSNPDTLIGHSTEIFTYTVQAGSNALIDTVALDGQIHGHDVNSNKSVSDIGAEEKDGWWVKQASDVEIVDFNTSQLTVTDGQLQDWHIKMVVRNSGGADLKLDSVRVNFSVGGRFISDEYSLIYPTTFVRAGDDTLRAGETDTLKIIVDETGVTLGTITVSGRVFLGDMISWQIIKNSVTGITVQSPAKLIMEYLRTSQKEVTVGQKHPWQIIASLTNKGGSDIAIDSTQILNFVSFDIAPETFDVSKPTGFFHQQNFILKSGKTDSLIFRVDTTGQVAGTRRINMTVLGRELNNQQLIVAKDSVDIKIELPAEIKIIKTENIAPNAPYVDANQQFQIMVLVKNVGEDAAANISVSLKSDSISTIADSTKMISVLPGSKSDTLNFDVTASSERIINELFSARVIAAVAENTPEMEKMKFGAPLDSFTVAMVQNPASMHIVSVISSQDTVKALTLDKWLVLVAVENIGEADLVLSEPVNENISIYINKEKQSDYSIKAPTKFQNSTDFILTSGEQDLLIYEITKTGFRGGLATIRASLNGKYPNSNQFFSVTDSTQIFIKPSADVYVNITEPVCLNVDQYGIGHVNSGQFLGVRVNVKNLGAERIDNIVINVAAPGYSVTQRAISFIPQSGDSSIIFNIIAGAEKAHLIFTATILSATAHVSGLPAAIWQAADSTAEFKIEKPALLRISVLDDDTLFTASQENYLKLNVTNLGTAEVDNSGQIAVIAPEDYRIVKNQQLVQADTIALEINQLLSWKILPPAYESNRDSLRVVLFKPPKEKNTNSIAGVQNQNEYLIVHTVPSNITVESFKIINPEGARDDIISTRQDFYVEVRVNTSENLDSIRAAISLPLSFGFGIQEDSLKYMPHNNQAWKLRAPEAASDVPALIKVRIYGQANGATESVSASFPVIVKKQAEIAIDRIWTSSLTDSILSSGQEFDLNVLVKSKNANQAKVLGTAQLRANFGATGITTSDPWIKSFKVDSVVAWKIKAPNFAKDKMPLTINLETIPYDENTNLPAIIADGETIKQFYIKTVLFGDIEFDNFRIASPIGATDKRLSTHQAFNVDAIVSWQNCADIPLVMLQLPPGFTTLESNPKQPIDSGQQGTVAWTIYAPQAAIADQNIRLQLSAIDANSGELLSINSEIIQVDVVARPEIFLNASIISPLSAVDGKISADETFVVRAKLDKVGSANLQGNYSVKISLPEGQNYSSIESAIQSTSYNKAVQWRITAPSSSRDTKNIIIELISPPQDENTNAPIPPEAIKNYDVEIPISTEEKSVTFSILPNSGKKIIAKGDTSVSMLGIKLLASGDAYSNKVLFSGVKIKLKDRQGKLISNPRNAINKLTIANQQNSAVVYGRLNNIPTENPIEVLFTYVDTLKPEIPNLVDFRVNVAVNATIADFQLAIDSSQALTIIDEGSGKKPIIKNEAGEILEALNIFSAPSVIIDADFNNSFFNYPNPFGVPAKPKTSFVYYLEQASDVKIQIYTILGERVWGVSYTKNDPQGRKGRHEGDIMWDARNENGDKVLNGVYVARIIISNNQEAITKIAVIK